MEYQGLGSSSRRVEHVDKVNRNQFVKAIKKIRSLLPLLSKEAYQLKFPSEQGISADRVCDFLMCQPMELMSWDNIIDTLMSCTMFDAKNSSIS